MSNSEPTQPATFRSLSLMNSQDTALVVIDVQEKLLPLIGNFRVVEWNIARLLEGAKILQVDVSGTEQYPQGLGETVASLRKPLSAQSSEPIGIKTMFSCRECESLFDGMSKAGVHNLLLCGIETHVCVAQSALDLLAQGFNVFVCVDAVGSRSELDHDIALRRLESNGVSLTTTEAALFEWCEQAGSKEFKAISQLVRQASPESK